MGKEKKKMSIGIFDSGVGGLTVLKEIRKILPDEKIFYFGDTARVPYGDRKKEFIIRYSKKITKFLLEQKVDAIVAACNTVSALALGELKTTFKIPIIGVIKAGVRTALNTTESNKIGVIATTATISSGKYEKEIKKLDNTKEVHSKACPLFVQLVEAGMTEGKEVNSALHLYLDEYKGKLDTLILGCTHYPLLKKSISTIYPDWKIIDPAKETALELKELLKKKELLKNDGLNGEKTRYYVTSNEEKFKNAGKVFLGEDIQHVELVRL